MLAPILGMLIGWVGYAWMWYTSVSHSSVHQVGRTKGGSGMLSRQHGRCQENGYRSMLVEGPLRGPQLRRTTPNFTVIKVGGAADLCHNTRGLLLLLPFREARLNKGSRVIVPKPPERKHTIVPHDQSWQQSLARTVRRRHLVETFGALRVL